MSDHKHVELTNWDSFVHLDDDGNPRTVTAEHKATMDVPVATLDAFLADARARWARVTVSDECPKECVAQLTTPEDKREARLAAAHAARAKE